MVANLSAEGTHCVAALWPNGAPAVLLPGRYLVDFESRKNISIGQSHPTNPMSKMELLHNKTNETPKVSLKYLL